MKDNSPSTTALRVAMCRAAHRISDDPNVFSDPLALRILGIENMQPDTKWLEHAKLSDGLRAFLVARCRYTEDELHAAIKRGIKQYVVLGAGLDTFAFRQSYPEAVLHVFEVDYPATQIWKRELLEKAAIPIPETLTFSPIDFENQTLEQGLRQTGFDTGKSTFFSWLGVTPYLTESAIMSTLQFVASMPSGSGIVFDYTISPSLLNPNQQKAFAALADRVASAGEPFQTFFDPALLKKTLMAMGFGEIEDLAPEDINARYFHKRSDGLRVSGFAHIMNARVF
jgi:methyltransferase (TIGR00027 family)